MCGHHAVDGSCDDLPDDTRPAAPSAQTAPPAQPTISRREVLGAAGLGGALLRGAAASALLAACGGGAQAGGPGGPVATVTSFPPPRTRTLTTTATRAGEYLYLPFDVGQGISRVQVDLAAPGPTAKLGIGLFDHRGPAYGSPGFRGIYGQERSSFYVAADSASQSFLPGPVEPGRWTVIVPVFGLTAPTTVRVTVTLTGGPAPAVPFTAGAPVATVLDRPGWYRGDLHCHTPESSDAWHQKTALTPAAWARTCREIGLDFVAMTDHNVVTANLFLGRDAGSDVLLMPGEEMTDWFHGHATVSGIDVGDWLDFRLSPDGMALPQHGARIDEFLATAHTMGAYVAAAHPSFPTLRWQYGAEMARPAGRTDGYELWTGSYGPDDERSVQAWDGMLRKGWRVWANGGSDLHGVVSGADFGFRAGTPTTVVYADALATRSVIGALRAGRSFVTRRPDGVEAYLSATRPGQAAIVGGAVHCDAGDPVTVTARLRRAGGYRAMVITQRGVLSTTELTADDQTVEATVPIPPGGGYVRVEVRGHGHTYPGRPLAAEGDMECLTNPIWLTVGDPPAGYHPMTAPPPDRPGPRRVTTA